MSEENVPVTPPAALRMVYLCTGAYMPDAKIASIVFSDRGGRITLDDRDNGNRPATFDFSFDGVTRASISFMLDSMGPRFGAADVAALNEQTIAALEAQALKRLGAGQFYLISIRDKDGQAFDGDKTYRLRVPPNPPVNQYWSVTAYDRHTHALIRNVSRASRASLSAVLSFHPLVSATRSWTNPYTPCRLLGSAGPR